MSASSPYPPHPYGPPATPSRRWWQHPALIIVLLVFIPPAGIVLAWLGTWKPKTKIIASVLALLWFVFILFQDPPEKKEAAADPKPTATAAPTPSETTAEPTPTPTPTPSEAPMPGVVTKTYAQASRTIGELIDGDIRAYSAYTDVDLPKNHDDWIVCFQGPTAGKTLIRAYADPTLHLVAPGTACPKREGTELHPEPTRDPAPDNGSTGDTGTGDTGTGSGSTGGSGSSGDDSSSGGGSSSSGGGVGVVHPGSFCDTPGAPGVTKKGTPMICGPGSDGRNRWHS
ncbi:hypothetical protein ACFWZ2_36470 [Streptomyces sp. NPDC059002]|uniref:hypothetical protein n=1 Tax=Streptomyces sp. NPDC059002 TaxID=3346690 RepID=UPI0036C39E71